MFRSKRVPRHLLLSEGGGEHPWIRRLLSSVLTLLVGIGLGVLASESTGLRHGNCQSSGYGISEQQVPAEISRALLFALHSER